MGRLIKLSAIWLLGLLIAMGCLMPVGLAAELSSAQLFELHCAGCHAQGGNILRRGKTLKLKALQQYKMDSAEAVIQIVAQGKGNMSAYQDRLSPAEIEAVAGYVLERANQGWKSPAPRPAPST